MPLSKKRNRERMQQARANGFCLSRSKLISKDDFKSLWDKQDGVCAICSDTLIESKCCVDHDHKSGNVRGILCVKCNSGIGMLQDSPMVLAQASTYVKTCVQPNPVHPKLGLVQPEGLIMEGNRILGVKANVEPQTSTPIYNPAIHKPGDRVLVRPPHSKKLIEIVIPELDADGHPMP